MKRHARGHRHYARAGVVFGASSDERTSSSTEGIEEAMLDANRCAYKADIATFLLFRLNSPPATAAGVKRSGARLNAMSFLIVPSVSGHEHWSGDGNTLALTPRMDWAVLVPAAGAYCGEPCHRKQGDEFHLSPGGSI